MKTRLLTIRPQHFYRRYFRANFLLFAFLFLFALLPWPHLYAHDIPESFQKLTAYLVKTAPQTYEEIDAILKPKRNDTIFMRYVDSIAGQSKYYTGQSYALNQIGRKYRNTSKFNKALEYHKKALKAATDGKNIEFKIFSLNMLGVVYRRRDAIKTALEYHQEALSLAEAVPNPSKGIKRSRNVSLNGIGNLYQTLGQYDIAIAQYKKSMELELQLHNSLGLAINHQNIGECLEYKGQFIEALEHYRSSLIYNTTIEDNQGKIICNNSIARIYIKLNKQTQAIELLAPNLRAAEALGDNHIITAIHINMGLALMQLNQLKKAEPHLFAGLKLANDHHFPFFASEANSYLSELYKSKGDYKSALAYYVKADSLHKEINNEVNQRYTNDLIIKYETEKKENEIASLAKENEIINLRLRRNKNTLIISIIVLALLTYILYTLYRQKQLKNEKQILTLERSMLRSQMNPHFLFNSLNSIKLYIINNEKKNAVHYLNKFSKLIRKILDSSSLKEISLADELDTIALYMNIENIRFSNEINFKINIDPSLDPHTIKIPSLILQPFLENALWHGLSSKEGEKNIELSVSQENHDFIKISIKDNGVGREASEKIKENKYLKRKSLGIDITKQRLANFSKDYQNSFQVEILDLYRSHKVWGTEVVLHIPTH